MIHTAHIIHLITLHRRYIDIMDTGILGHMTATTGIMGRGTAAITDIVTTNLNIAVTTGEEDAVTTAGPGANINPDPGVGNTGTKNRD